MNILLKIAWISLAFMIFFATTGFFLIGSFYWIFNTILWGMSFVIWLVFIILGTIEEFR